MSIVWYKQMTQSDAQQETKGSKMPFRFTKGSLKDEDHATFFRDSLFRDAPWRPAISRHDHSIEEADISFHVIIGGVDLGSRTLSLSYDPQRSDNNNAPTMHLLFDDVIKRELESRNMTGHRVQVERDDHGNYHMTIG